MFSDYVIHLSIYVRYKTSLYEAMRTCLIPRQYSTENQIHNAIE